MFQLLILGGLFQVAKSDTKKKNKAEKDSIREQRGHSCAINKRWIIERLGQEYWDNNCKDRHKPLGWTQEEFDEFEIKYGYR